MKTVLPIIMIGTALFGAVPAVAQPAKNIVLVHGAFADETSWNKVAAILDAKGYRVTQVQNPLTSLADDVAATKAVLMSRKVRPSWSAIPRPGS